uniref:Fibronectin type-III domain-containing protein n=1 Tax=Pavo cristatus TaxID=9049 RepID=A0A8C9L8Y4_PAVCR
EAWDSVPAPKSSALFLVYIVPFLFSFSGELYCSLPNPRNVHFESTNMKNVLHWLAPEGTGDGVLYNVKYSVSVVMDVIMLLVLSSAAYSSLSRVAFS